MDEEALAVKSEALKALGTKEIIDKITAREDELEKLLKSEAKLKADNAGYLASSGSDCQTVKGMLAELAPQAPENIVLQFNADGSEAKTKKATLADRDAWLIRQRKENLELAAAISKQADVAFQLESTRVDIEMAKKRYESLRAVLSLKTAQIEFLTEK